MVVCFPLVDKNTKNNVPKKTCSCQPIFIKNGMDSLWEVKKSMQKKKIIFYSLGPEQSEVVFFTKIVLAALRP